MLREQMDLLLIQLKDLPARLRQEGLDNLKDLVSSAKFITADLAGLPAALAPRTTDSNKNLAAQALGDLALAMGPHTRPKIPTLLPALLHALADVRAAALAALNTMLMESSGSSRARGTCWCRISSPPLWPTHS